MNKTLDIRVQEDPEQVSSPQEQVIRFLNAHVAFLNSIEIIDIEYSTICALSTLTPVPTGNITAIEPAINTANVTKLIPSENITAAIIQ